MGMSQNSGAEFIDEIVGGYRAAQVVLTANRLGLFQALEEGGLALLLWRARWNGGIRRRHGRSPSMQGMPQRKRAALGGSTRMRATGCRGQVGQRRRSEEKARVNDRDR